MATETETETEAPAKLKCYEVEIQRLDFSQIVSLRVGTVRGARGRRKLYGEAFMRDPWNPWIHFRVMHAQDEEDLCERFLKQLVHRGYVPLQARKNRNGAWDDWGKLDLDKYDLTHHIIFGGGMEIFGE